MANDDSASSFVHELKRRKGLNTVATISEALVHVAYCVDALKSDVRTINTELERLRREIGQRASADDLNRHIHRSDEEFARLWPRIDSRRTTGNGNGGGNGSGVQFVRLGLQVIGLGFLVLALLIAFASPPAMDLLRLIFTGAPAP